MKKPQFVIVDKEPCPEFREVGDTGYCECGGVLAVHEPYLTQLFDWMRQAP